jgi:3-mercaptopropionate dioxygenase
MCEFHGDPPALPPLGEDEYVVDSARVRAFIAGVRERIGRAGAPDRACELISPLFADLLADRDWLPGPYQAAAAESGMGGGIGQWLLFRAADRSLSLFSLVVPPGAMTPVHDHLAWGLVGIYRGKQDEEFYRPVAGVGLELVRKRPLDPGDFYALLPPRDDVHRVQTTSTETSVSIHLLANDTGCVWRHTYDEQTGEARPFRSGYVNAPCVNGDSAVFGEGGPG